MKKIVPALLSILFFAQLSAQNIGIGTPAPQRKLHVAGGLRLDTLSGSGNGIMKFDNNGDIVPFQQSGNVNDVLRGDGTWGSVATTSLPAGTIVGTPLYNNPALQSIGYTLTGELPVTAYFNNINEPVSANSWAPVYLKGIASKYSPDFNGQSLPAAWADNVLYVMNGSLLETYDPLTDVWAPRIFSTIAFFNLTGRKAVWTGTEFIVWGGHFTDPSDNGIRYNPSTNTWSTISHTSEPSARTNFTMVWTNNRIVIWGGQDAAGNTLNNGAMYLPATDTWITINTAGAPSARTMHSGVWAPQIGRLIIWGGSSTVTGGAGEQLNSGASFNPVTNTWTGSTSPTGAPSARYNHTAVWTGTEMIIFGGNDNGTLTNTGYKFNPAGPGTWTLINDSHAPPAVHDHAATWTPGGMVVTGGITAAGPSAMSYSYDAAANQWYSASPLVVFTEYGDRKYGHQSFLANDMVIIWGGKDRNGLISHTGYRYFLTSIITNSTFISPGQTMYLYQKD